MTKINELIQFKAGKKAIAEEVNTNFETLRLSNNEQEEKLNTLDSKFDKTGGKLQGALVLNDAVEINCETSDLILTNTTNYFKISGLSSIETFSGINEGLVILEFTTSRLLVNSNNLQLQSNVDRICKIGDCGIYHIENGIVKEINYFSAKENHTNSFQTQTILDCPKNEKGRADFIRKIELDANYMPIMTDFQNDICVISSSSYYDGNYVPWRVFRHHTNDAFGWLTQNGVNTGWLKIEFRNTTPKFKAFCINARNSADAYTHCPADFIIEGSNDDTNWTLLGQYNDNYNWGQNERRYFGLTYFDKFKYYRISITKNSGSGAFVGFGALEFFESKNDYTAYNLHISYRAHYRTTLTKMTIKEVMESQADRNGMFATGRFQIIPDTLHDAVNKLSLDIHSLYDEDMQDKIFEEYLITYKRPAIKNYLENNGCIEDAIYAWALEFASAGVRKGKEISRSKVEFERNADGSFKRDRTEKK